VHHSAIEGTGFKTLAEGERVNFEVTRGPKGLQAEKVRRA
jgi:CspA family cold shock protein